MLGGDLPSRPNAAAPIATALVLLEDDLRARAPRILVDDHARRFRIHVGLMGVPAGVAGAHDRRRGARPGESQNAGANCRTENSFAENFHRWPPFVFDVKINGRWRCPFRELARESGEPVARRTI